MQAIELICIVVLPVLALVSYVVWRSKPRRFRLSAKLPLVSINIEIDAQDDRDKLPPGP